MAGSERSVGFLNYADGFGTVGGLQKGMGDPEEVAAKAAAVAAQATAHPGCVP